MESLTITLKMDGKDKRFVAPDFINGKLLRKASEIADAFSTGTDQVTNFDSNLQFVCDVYGKQFDMDEFEEGTDARMLLKTIYAVTQYVLGQVELASRLLAGDSESGDSNEKN